MNINDILVLCKAGFTAEQIGKMSAVKPDTPPAPAEPAPKDTPAEPAPKDTKAEPAPKVTPDKPIKKEKEVTSDPAPASDTAVLAAAIADLKQAIVNSNITNSDQPAPKVDTVDSIINSMIGGK